MGMKNQWKILGDESILYIKRRNGEIWEAIVDTYDLYKLFHLGKTWSFYGGDKESFYIVSTIKGKAVQLHRYLMEAPSDLYVDHINGVSQDNRRNNMRLATPAENRQNLLRNNKNNKSGFRGVWFDKVANAWSATVTVNGQTMDFGKFETKELAEYVAIKARNNLMPFSKDARMTDDEIEQTRIAK